MTRNLMANFRKTRDRALLKKFYEEDGYTNIYTKPKKKWIEKFRLVSDLMNLKPGQRVLDVGCSSQMFRPYVEQKEATYVGVDLSRGFRPSVVADAESLGVFKPDTFDWILMSDVLEHLPSPQNAIREAAPLAEAVIAVVPCMYRLEALPLLPRHPDDNHLTKQSPMAWIREFRQAGYEDVRARGFFYCPSVAFYPIRPLTLLDRFLRTKPFRMVGSAVERLVAEKPFFRYLGQELVIIARRARRPGRTRKTGMSGPEQVES